jgi:hypothetical protein
MLYHSEIINFNNIEPNLSKINLLFSIALMVCL